MKNGQHAKPVATLRSSHSRAGLHRPISATKAYPGLGADIVMESSHQLLGGAWAIALKNTSFPVHADSLASKAFGHSTFSATLIERCKDPEVPVTVKV